MILADGGYGRAYTYRITVYSNLIILCRLWLSMMSGLPTPTSVTDLAVSRERSRSEVNNFLEADIVGHQLGSVPGWKAAFGARYDDELIAVCVLGRPVARHIDADEVISISRFATLPTRPANTGSWLIARARNWARLEGYHKMIAYAGVAGNYGTIYEAAGFELVKEDNARGDSWNSREDRRTVSEFTRRKWEYILCEGKV